MKRFEGCLSRGKVYRSAHELDKDGRCIFCDCTPKEARRKIKERSLAEISRRIGQVERCMRGNMIKARDQMVEDLVADSEEDEP